MSLYRKYRPQNFVSLVGQDHVSTTLSNALKQDRVNHAYLFTGPRGTGKTSSARIMAKAINCLNLKDAKPCEECEICRDINEGRLIDVIEIDAASNRGIDEMRDLREKINFAPTRAKTKIYIIDEVHMLTKEAFNALLKTLEEPPSHVYFILATTEVHKIPETILSRCQRFDFRRIDDKALVDRLAFIAKEESIDAEEQALKAIAHHAQGGLRDAIGLLEQLSVDEKLSLQHVTEVLGISGFASIEKLFHLLAEKNARAALDEIHELYTQGFDLVQFNKNFLEYLRKKMIQSVEEGQNHETLRLLKLVEHFRAAYDQSRFATIPQLPLEIAAIESCMDTKAVPVLASPAQPRPAVTTSSTSPAPSQPLRSHQGLAPTKMEGSPAPSDGQAAQLTFEGVKASWHRIVERLTTPAVKQTFQTSVLKAVNGSTIVLGFAAKFHLEKMLSATYRGELELAVSSLFPGSVKVECELLGKPSELTKEDEEMAAKVAEMFEGEVV